MTEQEWLTGTDPARMLHHCLHERHEAPGQAVGSHRRAAPLISDRKLRLFGAAVLRLRNTTHAPALAAIDRAERHADDPAGSPLRYSPGELSYIADIPDARRMAEESLRDLAVADRPAAALLRDIAGNPWRPVTLPKGTGRCPDCSGRGWVADSSSAAPGIEPAAMACHCSGGAASKGAASNLPCPWLTPTVPSLARAAYAERPGRRCETCGGKGWEYVLRGGRLPSESECGPCRGTGRIDDGLLDPEQLLVLADALEEAGCAEVESACPRQCWVLYGVRVYSPSGAVAGEARRCDCRRGKVRTPHPLLAHLRSPGPHVRGCWALDLVLGRE